MRVSVYSLLLGDPTQFQSGLQMESSSIERKRQLKAEVAECKRAWKVAKKAADSEAQAAASKAKQWQLDGLMLDTALVIFVWSNSSLPPTVQFLKARARQKKWPDDKLDEEVSTLFLDAFLADDDARILELTDEANEAHAGVQKEAQQRLLKWFAAEWNAEQNLKGAEPTSSAVLDQLELIRQGMPLSIRPPPWGSSGSAGARKKLTRLRATHGGRLGKLKTRDDIDTASLVEKCNVAWQWSNHLFSKAPEGKRIVLINIDETAISLCPRTLLGNIFITKAQEPVRMQRKSDTRANLTHVAVVCSEPELQRLMPQVIIGNEHTIPARMLQELREKCGPRVRVLRNLSSWVNGPVFAQIITMVARALAPHRSQIQPIVQFDTYGGHLTSEVWRACTLGRLWPLVVPAKTTFFLQALDTEGFAQYKFCLQRDYQLARVRCAPEPPTLGALFDSVLAAIDKVLDAKAWNEALARNGFAFQQAGVSPKKLIELGLNAPLGISSERPTPEQLQLCFPRRKKVNFGSLWRAVDGNGLAVRFVPKAKPRASASAASSSSAPAGPISTRTRAKTRVASSGRK